MPKINMNLLPTQKKFVMAEEKYLAYTGGFGSGKTNILCRKAILLAIKNQGCPGVLVAPSYKMLHNPVTTTLYEILEEQGIPFHHQKSLNILKIGKPVINDIYLRSGDAPDSLRGPTVSFFGLDEAAMQDKLVWKICMGRLRHPKAKELKGFLVTTPEGFDWTYEEFVEKTENNPKRRHYKLFQAPSDENYFLPVDYVNDLKEDYDGILAELYIKGKYVDNVANKAYYSFGDHNIKPLPLRINTNLSLACDFNVAPLVFLVGQVFENKIHILRELVIHNNAGTEQGMMKFLDFYAGFMKARKTKGHRGTLPVHIFGDASGANRTTAGDSDYVIIRECLKGAGIPYTMNVPEANPFVKDRLNSANRAFKNRGEYTRVFIDPSNKLLIKDLKRVTLTSKGDIDKRRLTFSHASDALSYLIYNLMPIRKNRGKFSTRNWNT